MRDELRAAGAELAKVNVVALYNVDATRVGMALGAIGAAVASWPEPDDAVNTAYRDGFDDGLERGQTLDQAGYSEGYEAGVRFMIVSAEQTRRNRAETSSEDHARAVLTAMAQSRAEGYAQGCADMAADVPDGVQFTDSETGLTQRWDLDARMWVPVEPDTGPAPSEDDGVPSLELLRAKLAEQPPQHSVWAPPVVADLADPTDTATVSDSVSVEITPEP